MSEPITNTDMDELSRLLDEINIGGQPKSTNKEMAELLAIATLIKEADLAPSRPPQHILNQTIDLVIADIPAKRRFNWLYSGALSTAAAVILVIGLNAMPLFPEKLPTISIEERAMQSQNIPQEKIIAEQSPITEPSPTATTTFTETSVTSPITQPVPSKPLLPADTRVKSTPILQKEPPKVTESNVSEIPRHSPTLRAKPPTPSLVPLSLLGRLPDSITSDTKSGTVRQVYGKGTPQEVIITQRVQSAEPKSAVFTARSSVLMEKQTEKHEDLDQATSKTFNKVTVTINNQEVTVEGYLTRKELQKLADSLSGVI